MTIATYAELQSAIADFLNRQDMTSVIPTFIALAEAQIARDVRHWRMIEQTTLTVDGQYEAIPADWVETIRMVLSTSDRRRLETGSLNELMDRRHRDDTVGAPMLYAHVGDQFEFYPTPDGSYSVELTYYKTIPALSVSNTSNWLLTQAPDVYLYGSLIQSAPYLSDDQRATIWAGFYAASVSQLNAASDAARTSGSLRLRTRNQ
jgi:hypothetical protein